MSTSTGSYQPYVEDFDSVLGEVVPLTRRTTNREKSSLSQSQSASNFDGISDSGYSSHSTNTPNAETPPPPPVRKSETPAPVHSRKESYPQVQQQQLPQQPQQRSKTPFQRSASKSFSRTASPAVPRNIPGAKPRERSATVSTSGGADECDCSDCKKSSGSKGSPSSPSILSGAWPAHGSFGHHSPYSQSPQWPTYQYPQGRYDGYTDSGATDTSDSSKKRNSMGPPPRPSSTFSAATASSYGYGASYYSKPAPSPAPAPPTPSSTCPPPFSAYAPPPINTSVAAAAAAAAAPSPILHGHSPYAPPPVTPYSYVYDSWSTPSPSSSYPTSDYSTMPPPPPPINRRNSMRAQASSNAYHESTDENLPAAPLPPSRRSSRVYSGERPPSWTSCQFEAAHHRSMSVPPAEIAGYSEARRKLTTPGPAPMRRRESGHSQGSAGAVHPARLGPSALSRAMESCAIDDDPVPASSHSRSRSYYDSTQHGQVARREAGTLIHHTTTHSDSASSRSGGAHHEAQALREELVSLTVPNSDEPFTMRYPAGIPVKLNVNGGSTRRRIAMHSSSPPSSTEKSESVELKLGYRFQQRQQQVHAQLQYGALEHGASRRSSGEYTYRLGGGYTSRRATMNGI